MPHHDEKGRISPAQSKVAQQMRAKIGESGAAATRPGLRSLEEWQAIKRMEQKHHLSRGRKPLLPMSEHQRSMLGKTMGGMAKEQEEKHHYGKGLKRLEYMKKTSPNKIAKARVALRGQKSDYRKAYTKGLTEVTKRFKAKGFYPSFHQYGRRGKD